MKRLWMLLLSVILLISLSSCKSQSSSESDLLQYTSNQLLHAEYISLPDCFSTSEVQLQFNDGIYLAGTDNYGNVIHGLLIDNSFAQFENSFEKGVFLAGCNTDDGIAVLVSESNIQDEGSDSRGVIYIQKYSQAGKLISSTPLPNENESITFDSDFFSLLYQDGFFYVMSSDLFVQLDSSGGIKNLIDLSKSTHLPGIFVSQCKIGEKLAVCMYGYGITDHEIQATRGANIFLLDKSSFELELIYSDEDSWPRGIGCENESTLLFFDEVGLYRVNIESLQVEQMLTWSEADLLLIPYNNIIPMSASEFLLVGKDLKQLCVLSSHEQKTDRIELTVLCTSPSLSLNTLVQQFNLTHSDYHVTIQRREDNENLAKIKTITGDTPDIYFFYGNTPFNASLQQNLFEDLYSFIDADPDCDRNLIVPSLKSQIENQGSLYILPFDYMIWTFITTVKLDNVENMSLDQFIRTMEQRYPGQMILQQNISRDDMWYWVSNLCVGSFIDQETGKCYFDSNEYIGILKSLLLISTDVSNSDEDSLLQFQQMGTLLRAYAFGLTFDNNYYYLGCPTGGFSNGSSFDLQQCYAISANSKNKEGAWQFLKYVMSAPVINIETVADDICLPASSAQLDSMLGQALGNGYAAYGMSIQIKEHDEQELRKLISQANSVMGAHPEIIEIMQEEAIKFFSGEKTAEDVAAATQSRVSIFMAEQYG